MFWQPTGKLVERKGRIRSCLCQALKKPSFDEPKSSTPTPTTELQLLIQLSILEGAPKLPQYINGVIELPFLQEQWS